MKTTKYLEERFGYEPFINFVENYAQNVLGVFKVESYEYNKEDDVVIIEFLCLDNKVVRGEFYPFRADLYFADGNKHIISLTQEWQKVVISHTKNRDAYIVDLLYEITNSKNTVGR